MKMIKLQINNREIECKPETRLLDAAQQAGFAIPTMCYLEGLPHFTSCMICVVQDMKTGRMLPSCSLQAAEGMVIETDNEAVQNARREALELLMSDHVGDCVAPCQRTCPAHMNIPMMNLHIEAGRDHEALVTVKEHIALPAVLGRICPAPCEKNCRRDSVDSSISICSLKCYVADQDLLSGSRYLPERKAPSGKTVGIIGCGPAGLAAAYHLQQFGHACTIFDDHAEPGGMLRYGIPEDVLPRNILDAEIDVIRLLGAKFEMNRRVGKDISVAEVRQSFDAVALAMGPVEVAELEPFEVETTPKTVRVDSETFATSVAGIYAGGGIINPGKLAIRSVGHGRSIAIAIDNYLTRRSLPVLNSRSQSRIAKVEEHELRILSASMENLKAATFERKFDSEAISGVSVGVTSAQAVTEAAKCIQCGCASFHHCKLRIYSEQYGANSKRYKGEMRRPLKRVFDHPYVVYEPGKCIQCGLCVRITEKEKNKLGLTFIGRGFEVRVDAALEGTMDAGLAQAAADCVDACPSGALEFKSRFCYK